MNIMIAFWAGLWNKLVCLYNRILYKHTFLSWPIITVDLDKNKSIAFISALEVGLQMLFHVMEMGAPI